MQVDDDIAHFGVVDGALCRTSPSLFSLGIIVEHADEINCLEVDEVEGLRIVDPSAEHKVELAHQYAR